MPGIIPNPSAGAVDATTPGLINVYIPGEDFTFDGCTYTALPSDGCTARILPAQINAIVSELISFAECMNPDGTWECASLQNLCAAFSAWRTETGPGSMSEALENLIQFTDCNAEPIPLDAALVTCANLAEFGADRYVTGIVDYNDATNVLTLSMSTPGNLDLNLTAVVNDAVASIIVNHDTSLNGNGQAVDPLRLNIQHDASLAGEGSQAVPLALAVQHDTSLSGNGSTAVPLTVVQATTLQLGGAQLATQAEVNALVNATDIVTPSTLGGMSAGLVGVVTDATLTGNGKTATPLSVVQATMTQRGGMEIATQAEVDAGLSSSVAVTPLTLQGFTGTSPSLFLATGQFIDWGAGDLRITGNANQMAFSGAASGYTFDGPLLLSGTQLTYTDTVQFGIRANTSDGADTSQLQLAGGGATSSARGGFIVVHGNEAGTPGKIRLVPGVTAVGTDAISLEGATRVTGALSVTAALTADNGTITNAFTVNGAFTSRGIDDNATGERVQLEDTQIILGAGGANDFYIGRNLDTGSLTIGGSTFEGTTLGAQLKLFGSNHATLAGDFRLSVVGASNIGGVDFDASAGQLTVGASGIVFMDAGSAVRVVQNTTNVPGNGNNTLGAGMTLGTHCFSGNGGTAMAVNKSSDGSIISLHSGGVSQGSITISGSTTNYLAFTGSHWSQLGDGSKPNILRGTICESINEMSVWLALRYTDDAGIVHTSEDVPVNAKVGDIIDLETSYEADQETPVIWYEDEFEKEEFDEPYGTVEIIEGKATLVERTRRKSRMVEDEMIVHDSDGNVIMETVPERDEKGSEIFDEVPNIVDGVQIMKTVVVTNRKGSAVTDAVLEFDDAGKPVMIDVAVMGDDGRQLFDLIPAVDGNGKPIIEYLPVLHEDGSPVFDKVFVTDDAGKRVFDMVPTDDPEKPLKRVARKELVQRTKPTPRLIKLHKFEKRQRTRRVKRTKQVPEMIEVLRTKQVEKRVMVPRIKKVKKTDIKREHVILTKIFQAEVIQLRNDQLSRFKVSDTAGSSRVYGVFGGWDEISDLINDAIIPAIGTYVIRLGRDVIVTGGELIDSNGDGTGRIQDSDIFRSSTVAKITSSTVIETYTDGSYIVPCTLHCG